MRSSMINGMSGHWCNVCCEQSGNRLMRNQYNIVSLIHWWYHELQVHMERERELLSVSVTSGWPIIGGKWTGHRNETLRCLHCDQAGDNRIRLSSGVRADTVASALAWLKLGKFISWKMKTETKDEIKLYIYSCRWVLHQILPENASSKYFRQKMKKIYIWRIFAPGARDCCGETPGGWWPQLRELQYCTQPTLDTMGGVQCTCVQCSVHVYTTRRPSVATLVTTLSVVPDHWRGKHTSSALKRYHQKLQT